MEPHQPQGSKKEPVKEPGRRRREEERGWPPALLPPKEESHRAPVHRARLPGSQTSAAQRRRRGQIHQGAC